jgi:hypothetical protein
MKNLECLVTIQGWTNFGNHAEVTIDKLAEPAIVINGSCAASTAHIELKPGNAESVLHVDRKETHPESVTDGRFDLLLLGPSLCLCSSLLIWNSPNLSHLIRMIMFRDWKLIPFHI